MLYRFPIPVNISETPITCWDSHRAQRLLLFIQTTATLETNGRANEASGIAVQLEITSQSAVFFKQILSFLAYGVSSVMP
jgi:hypothetical protein